MIGASGVVVAASGRVAEGVVGVVDLLEGFGAFGALAGLGFGDAVGVGFQGGSVQENKIVGACSRS